MDRIVLRPHCDLHMLADDVLHLRPLWRTSDGSGVDRLEPITNFQVQFLSPYRKVGERFMDLPVLEGDRVRSTRPGVYLFHLWFGNEYMVGRLQVHSELVDWWFGQDSITTGRDLLYAHSQPSVYARFNDGDPDVDLVGDITDSGLVELTSADPARLRVEPGDRLRGVVETSGADTVMVRGRFKGGMPKELPVRVVDYLMTSRPVLEPLRIERLAEVQTVPNMVFLSEGFLAEDRGRFDAMVDEMVHDMFEKPRNQPFGMLGGSMNVFKAFVPSQQRGLTVGNRIRDIQDDDRNGRPIPAPVRPGARKTYQLSDLVGRVGLAPPAENRPAADILADWQRRLLNIDPGRVPVELIEEWRTERSDSILDARDTFFGLIRGSRLADNISRAGGQLAQPVDDDPANSVVRELQRRVYQFFEASTERVLTSDPRRHPPELQLGYDQTPRRTSITDFFSSLKYSRPPFQDIGSVWVPDLRLNKPSRGLVGIVVHDALEGGTNFNDGTMCAVTLQPKGIVSYERDGFRIRRKIAGYFPVADLSDLGTTFVHEFGHSLNLGDEYEEADGESPQAEGTTAFDNLATRHDIRLGTDGEKVDARKVKWLGLPRVRESARIVATASATPGEVVIRIDRRDAAHWYQLWGQQLKVSVRIQSTSARGEQLLGGPARTLTGLSIARVNRDNGDVVLTGEIPIDLTIWAGSLLYVPLLDENGAPRHLAEPKVLGYLNDRQAPMNSDPDNVFTNDDDDDPKSIRDFKGPCNSSRLIGVYEGGWRSAGGIYRPAGSCRMRDSHSNGGDGEFCFVCSWLIVNRLDPSYHALLDSARYPEPKKR
ncbi:M64 family metallopeptidase [Kribbella albertanoniae]|uniref:M64 family metallopeptidase n=1 Tax=Kribbella albertanoniae TaxID=1266829 RepID=UPI0014044E11|nr:M64 family metallopeptidase [Kribbella albertanoniae]